MEIMGRSYADKRPTMAFFSAIAGSIAAKQRSGVRFLPSGTARWSRCWHRFGRQRPGEWPSNKRKPSGAGPVGGRRQHGHRLGEAARVVGVEARLHGAVEVE